MPLSRRQLSTPAQNAAEPAWPRARRGRLKEPSDSASDAEDDAEARSGRLESEAELAERRSGGMRGVNLRSAASSDAAAASSPSDSDSEDDAAAKSGRLESDSEFSDRRSGGMGGIPAGGAGPPPPGGTRARRRQRSSQLSRRAPSLLPGAPLPRVVARGVRPLLSRRRAPLVRPARQRSRSSAAYLVGVWQRTAQATQGTVRLSRSRQRSDEVQNRVVRSRASFYASPRPPLLGEQGQQQSASATRGLARVAL